MDDDAVIDALNDLIRVVEDSHLGLQRAAGDLDSDDLVSLCNTLADRRGSMIRDIQERVAALGGAPDATGTLLGGARRMAAGLGAAIGARDNDDILEGLVHEQDSLLHHLDHTIAKDLPRQVKAELASHAEAVTQDRDRLRAALDAVRAPASPGRANA